MKLAYFGVTGNPAHNGHVNVVKKALEEKFDMVWVVPVYQHPFGKEMLAYDLRKEMLIKAFQDVKNAKVLDIDMLFVNQTQDIPFTYNVLKFCRKSFGVSPEFLIGGDNHDIWEKFKYGKELKDEFGVYVIEDNGVHSTEIREMAKKQQWDEVSKYCNPDVVEFIKLNNLYQS